MKLSSTIIAMTFIAVIANTCAIPIERTRVNEAYLQKKSNDFLTPQSVAVLCPGSSILVDCRTDNKTLKTALYFSRSLHESFGEITSRSNVEVVGQVFTIHDINWTDDGYYMCARQDRKGKASITLEVFVVEEGHIYNSYVLKHQHENETFGSLEVCKKYLTANAAERKTVCGTNENIPTSSNASIDTAKDLERIRRSFRPMITAWKQTSKLLFAFKECMEVTLQAAINVCNEVHHATVWTKTCISKTYENGVWNLTSQAARRFIDYIQSSTKKISSSIKDNIALAYEKGLWSALCDIASWYKMQLYKISRLAIRVIFYARAAMAKIAMFLDGVIFVFLKAKETAMTSVLDQLQRLSEEKTRIENLVSSYSEKNFIDALKGIAGDMLSVSKTLFTWILTNIRDLIILYKSAMSYITVSLKVYAASHIPEDHINEITQYFNDIATWFDDVITVIQLIITWFMYNIAMAILKISELLDPSSDVTFTSPYGRETFWEASRMDLVKTGAEVTWCLLTSAIFSKMMRIIVDCAVIYRNAIFSKHDMAYNMVVVLMYVGIYTVCRMKAKIGAAMQPLIKSITRRSQSFWRRCSKTAAHKHHILLLTRARRTKTLYMRFLPTIVTKKVNGAGGIVTVDCLGSLNELCTE
ncbi:uncharacterized protein LOC114575557 [Exaiptasia diaphana]|uniref:Uncharacterized protein n=1 Tax=Exaiptasia diaphana TaxID=2652724 RepID=A0A913YN38_EXADI|nr:uncharacterized protein LOC114575557 [Exaiptasia diaphana]